EKKARREARRLKRERKALKKSQENDGSPTGSANQNVSEIANDRNDETVTSTASQSGISAPLFSAGRGRHVIRQRYIQQKKMACLDEKALNEVSRFISTLDVVINLDLDFHDQIQRIT